MRDRGCGGDVAEEWRDVVGYEGFYQVSNLGRVRGVPRQACNGKMLKQFVGTTGYPMVTLSKHCAVCQKRVHRLVAEAFIPNPDGKPQINHINGDKTDYRIENLEWVTGKENIRHAVDTGLFDPAKGQMIAVEARRKAVIRSDGAVFESLHEAARESGTCAGNVCKVLKGIRPKAGGYSFRYLEETA